jgi:hypothetical protein
MNSFFDTPASKINIKDSFNPEFPNTWKETVGSTYGQYGGQKFNTKVFDGDQGWNTGNGAAQYLSGTGKNKYTQRGQQSGTYFGGQQQGTYFGGPGGIQIADDITVVPGTSTPGFTVQAPQQKSSGLGGAIGTVAGAIGGSFIPGVGTGLGAGLGGTIGGLFD